MTLSCVTAAALVTPGTLVDIHAHGGVGHQFGADCRGTLLAIAHHRAQSVERVVASLVTATDAALIDQVGVLAPLVAEGVLAGIHLEGPFLSVARCGAHDRALVRDPDPGLIERLAAVAAAAGAPRAIRHLTFAPERPGAAALVETCARLGIVPAIGHTDADAGTITRAIGRIAERTGSPALVTHLFNGMPAFHHRAGGPAAAALAAAARGEAIVELIADGVHVSPEVVAMVFDLVGPDRVALVSDAMAATGLGDGRYRIGALPVDVRAGTARLVGPDGTLGPIAGSTHTLADCVAWAVGVAGIAPADARRAASITPARAIALSLG